MKKSLLLALVAALFLFVACGDKKDSETEQEPEKTDGDIAENHGNADEDSSNTEPTGDAEQTDGDSENINDSEPENNDVDNTRVKIREECRGDQRGHGGEGCNISSLYNQHREPNLVHECELDCGDYNYGGNCYFGFKVTEIDQASDDVKIKGKCLDKTGKETDKEATLTYPKYSNDPQIPETLVGIEIRGLSISYPTGQFHALKTSRGELIYAHNGGIWDWEIIHNFIPDLKTEQKIIPTCESVCIMYNYDVDCDEMTCDKEPYYDYVYYPPIEFTFEGKEPVLVGVGDVVESEGCEYYVFFSKIVAPEDSDQEFYSNEGMEMPAGTSSETQFYIFNINALK